MHHGKEIYIFFGQCNLNGILGICISCTLIGIIIYKTLNLSKKENISEYKNLLNKIIKNKNINEIIYIIMNVFLLISFYIMIAGFSAYFSQEIGVLNIIGNIIIILLCYIVFIGNIKSIIKINMFLTPILSVCILLLMYKNINEISYMNLYIVKNNFIRIIFNSIIYASYNSIVLIPILLSLQKYINKKEEIKWVAIISTIILLILAFSIYIIISKINIDIDINKIELPTVYVANLNGKMYQYCYGIIILVAMYTSAISAGYGFLENYSTNQKKYKIITIIICITSFFISKIGFTKLINWLYPIFGFLGILQIGIILKKN